MNKLITMTLVALTTAGGVAMADHPRRDRDGDGYRDGGRRGAVVRGSVGISVRGGYRQQPRRVRYERRVIRQNDNRFIFHGGITRSYRRPVFQTRYVNRYERPQVHVENMQPVEGYNWVAGHWHWTGYEWSWQAGYYAPDANYGQYGYYNDTSDYNGGYNSDYNYDYNRNDGDNDGYEEDNDYSRF